MFPLFRNYTHTEKREQIRKDLQSEWDEVVYQNPVCQRMHGKMQETQHALEQMQKEREMTK